MTDEVTFLVNLIEENWDSAITTMLANGHTIPAEHRVHPQIMDRDWETKKVTSSVNQKPP